MNFKTLGLALVFASAAVAPAFAHHPFAEFDSAKSIAVSGTVKKFEWVSPHSRLHLMAADAASGKPVEWRIEMASPSELARLGWKPDSVEIGSTVSVTLHPLKNGLRGGQFVSAMQANGKPLAKPSSTHLVVAAAASTAFEPQDTVLVLPQSVPSTPLVLMTGVALIAGAWHLRNRMSRLEVRA
jgi:hypothetical protein